MSHTAQATPIEAAHVISAAVAAQITEVGQQLVLTADRIDDPQWVAAARSAWTDLPAEYRRAIGAFRRHSGPAGALVLRGLPVDTRDLPTTPLVRGSVQRTATLAAALLVMTACGLGDPAAFLAEKSGALVQDVVPVPGQEYFQGNAGSVDLMMHNENAFHEHRPDYVLLLCLRPDHEGIAGLSTASIREALPKLSDRARQCLRQIEFTTQPPPSFAAPDSGLVRHAVLTATPEDPDIRVDFAATTGLTLPAREALAELSDALEATARTVLLRTGDLAIVDNRVCLHGRSAFRPRYDGRDRWLQRTFALADLRRSRSHRTDDGYVLVR